MERLKPYPASADIKRKIEVFARRPVLLRGETDQHGERRYVALEQTEAGRHLMVVFTVPRPGRAKVITARESTRAEALQAKEIVMARKKIKIQGKKPLPRFKTVRFESVSMCSCVAARVRWEMEICGGSDN